MHFRQILSLTYESLKNVKANKDICLQMTDQINEIISAIINICCDTTIKLPLATTESVRHFFEYAFDDSVFLILLTSHIKDSSESFIICP